MVKFVYGDKGKKGRIVTDLDTIEFFSLVMKEWAQYDEYEIEVLIGATEDWEIEEKTLMEDGFDILENMKFVQGEMITLKKVGHGEWIISGYSDEDMDEFVDSIQDNLD